MKARLGIHRGDFVLEAGRLLTATGGGGRVWNTDGTIQGKGVDDGGATEIDIGLRTEGGIRDGERIGRGSDAAKFQ